MGGQSCECTLVINVLLSELNLCVDHSMVCKHNFLYSVLLNGIKLLLQITTLWLIMNKDNH